MYTLKTKLLTISLILCLSLGITFALYSYVTTNAYQRLRLESIRKSIKYESEKANRIIQEIENGAVQLAINGLLFQLSQSDIIGETAVQEYLKRFPTTIATGLWFEPYTYDSIEYYKGVNAFRNLDENVVVLDYIEHDYDYFSMSWYREIFDSISSPLKAVWIKPYIDDTTFKMVITAGAGIYDLNHNLIGISTLDWELDDVIEALSEIKPTEKSIILLHDPEHDFVIANTLTDSRDFPIIVQEEVLDSHIPEVINLASRTWLTIYAIEASVVIIDDVEYFSLSRVLNNGWELYIYAPIKEIFIEKEHLNLQYTIIYSIIALFVLLIAYYCFYKIVYSPINHLTKNVTQISLGNLNIRSNITSSDEIGTLAKAFNKMTSDLQNSIEAYTKECAQIERINAELHIATTIQTSMLPSLFPPFPERTDFDIFATMQPMREVGGDFYDFFFVDEKTLAFLIADVSDKGVPAALFMSLAKTLINNHAVANKSPKEVLFTVNNLLYEKNNAGMFVTAFLGYYNTETGKLCFVNAGHNPPLYSTDISIDTNSSERQFQYLKAKPCPILAWRKNSVYKETEIFLNPNDILYLYTDGVTEAMDINDELFSEERLLDILNNINTDQITEILTLVKNEITLYAKGVDQADDITMLALKVNNCCFNRDEEKQIICDAKIENLDNVIDFINLQLDNYSCSNKIRQNINLIIEEIFVNIANYAYENKDGLIYLSIFKDNDSLVLRIEDTGKPFNLLEHPTPKLDSPADERPIGGLGVYLVKKLSDKVSYVRLGNRNVIVMLINIS